MRPCRTREQPTAERSPDGRRVRKYVSPRTRRSGVRPRDARLRDLLVSAIDSIRALEGLPPLPQPVDAPVISAHPLPVTTHLAAVHPVLGLRVAPLLDLWPDWIREPWNRRLHELCLRNLTKGEDRPQQPAGTRQAVAV
jgi:hypothetical protein